MDLRPHPNPDPQGIKAAANGKPCQNLACRNSPIKCVGGFDAHPKNWTLCNKCGHYQIDHFDVDLKKWAENTFDLLTDDSQVGDVSADRVTKVCRDVLRGESKVPTEDDVSNDIRDDIEYVLRAVRETRKKKKTVNKTVDAAGASSAADAAQGAECVSEPEQQSNLSDYVPCALCVLAFIMLLLLRKK